MGPDVGEKVVSGASLSASENLEIADHVSWLIRETWKKYEQLQNNAKTNNPKPLNDNSSLNIRYEKDSYHEKFL